MIANITTGTGFGGTVRYIFGKEGAVPLGGSFGAAATWEEISEEARILRTQMGHIQKPVFHVSLNLAPGEHLEDATWRQVAHDYLEGMGMARSPHVLARHTDAEHEHIHIVVMRWDPEKGRAVDLWQSKTRSAVLVQELEALHGLQRATRLPSEARAMAVRAPEGWEMQKAARDGVYSLPRVQIREAVADVLGRTPSPQTLPAFVEAARRRGVEVTPNLQSMGRVSGLRYTHLESGTSFKASQLGKAYGLAALEGAGVTYQPGRDWHVLRDPDAPPPPRDLDRLLAHREALRQRLDHVLAGTSESSLPAFADKALAHGIEVVPNLQSTGRLSGLRYVDLESGVSFKASELGKAYGVRGLETAGVTYDRERDAPALRAGGASKPAVDIDI